MENDARPKSIYVKQLDVSTVIVLINSSATNVFVNPDGLEICVMKTLMIASEAQPIQATPLAHVKMVGNVLIRLTILFANAYLDSLARNVRYMSLSYLLNFYIK